MLFKLNVWQTDDDYLEFNKFWMLRSHYGKKQLLSFRLMLIAMTVIFSLISLWGGGFSLDSFIGIIPFVAIMLILFLCLPKILAFGLKHQIKSLKKSGKMGYSPSSVIEFYDDEFTEATEENQTRQKYTAIERISIVNGKNIYIHINNIMAYILPWYCFDSDKQRDEFIEFIKTKCENIDIYR